MWKDLSLLFYTNIFLNLLWEILLERQTLLLKTFCWFLVLVFYSFLFDFFSGSSVIFPCLLPGSTDMAGRCLSPIFTRLSGAMRNAASFTNTLYVNWGWIRSRSSISNSASRAVRHS